MAISAAVFSGVDRVEHDQAGILHPAVGILECAAILRPQRLPRRVRGEIDAAGRGQDLTAAEMVVNEQPETDQPGRPQALVMRKHEPERADDVGRGSQQNFALQQRLVDEAELVVLEVAQAAVDQLRRRG